MILSEQQKDNLSELINISFSRSANSLSELTGYNVLLSVPEINVYAIDELSNELKKHISNRITTVHQVFNGVFGGDAMLMFDSEGAKQLADLLINPEPDNPEALTISLKEVIVEVGNILLNSCLGMFGNLLKVQFSFSVPSLYLESLEEILNSVFVENEQLQYAIVATMSFKLREVEINGLMTIVLNVTSLEKFLTAVEIMG